MTGNIFNKHILSHFVDTYRKNLAIEVDKLEITGSTSLHEIAKYLENKFTIEPLVLHEPKPSAPIEKMIERQNELREIYRQKVYEISITIQFDGDRQLFDCRPSSSKIIYLDDSVYISQNFISAKIVLEDFDIQKYETHVSKLLSDLSSNIPMINSEISPWNAGLKNHIDHLIEKRKGLVSRKLDFMEKIGLKVNPTSNDFIPTPVTRKSIPKPVSETSEEVRKELIPTLQEEVYKDIKEVLYNVGKAIERKPSLYLDKFEEDLRDIFLLFLETRYDSSAGVGEAFNKKGRTDILLKYAKDGTNLFVAECKFWKGQKKLFEAINQLLGYLTHRDSKTALMFFIDQKEFTSVKQTLKTEIVNHPNYKRYLKDNYDSSFGYEFDLPSDSQKIIHIEVMLFHFPK